MNSQNTPIDPCIQSYSKLLRVLQNTILEDTSQSDTKDNVLEKFCDVLENKKNPQWVKGNKIDDFLKIAIQAVRRELTSVSTSLENDIKKDFDDLYNILLSTDKIKLTKENSHAILSDKKLQNAIWKIFNKEAEDVNLGKCITSQKKEGKTDTNTVRESIQKIRDKRTLKIETENPNPITNPASQIIFTSNILLTIPKKENIDTLHISSESKQKLHNIIDTEQQTYWYDHPMPLGVEEKANELIYGLRGLCDAVVFEKRRGTMAQDEVLTVLLSVSVTHVSLAELVHEYLENDLAQFSFDGLDVYVFTENNTKKIAGTMDSTNTSHKIENVFGVDGRYGRHYSFLKAIAAVWATCVDDKICATFKIDLDQVFPQELLVEETGKSMLEHFCTPLWGAQAIDSEGNKVHLGMIAGALVNEADIGKGLFTPDVNFPLPEDNLDVEDVLFPRIYFMALSTRAELMARYQNDMVSPKSIPEIIPKSIPKIIPDIPTAHALQRVHVTGGTNGILIDALKKYRPFTPSFIARAEDQAYILSVFLATYKDDTEVSQGFLRYVHAGGLFMRHDKAAFASEAIKQAKYGSYAGDLLRTMVFSKYFDALEDEKWQFTKYFSPFTSCFTSNIPVSFVMARLLLHCEVLAKNTPKAAKLQLEIAADVLTNEIQILEDNPHTIKDMYKKEKGTWNIFYDNLATLSLEQRNSIKKDMYSCKIV